MDTRPRQRGAAAQLLTEQEGEALLRVGGRALHNHLRGLPPPSFEEVAGQPPPPPRLEQRRGSFATLKRGEALRGCIGFVEPRDALWRDVRTLAVLAATRDTRFPPVRADELDDLSLSLSVLTPPEPIRPEEVEVGRHGLIVQRGPFMGLLLPQVATEHGMDAPTFLAHTCLKAGLAPQAWRDPGTQLFGFEAQLFGPRPVAELD